MTEINGTIDLIDDTSTSYTFWLFGGGGNAQIPGYEIKSVYTGPNYDILVKEIVYKETGGGGSGGFIQIEAPRLVNNTQLTRISVSDLADPRILFLVLIYSNGYSIHFQATGGSDGTKDGGPGGSAFAAIYDNNGIETTGISNYLTYSPYNGVRGADTNKSGTCLKTSSGSGLNLDKGIPYPNNAIVTIPTLEIANRGSGETNVAIGYGSGGAPSRIGGTVLNGTRKAIFYLKNN